MLSNGNNGMMILWKNEEKLCRIWVSIWDYVGGTCSAIVRKNFTHAIKFINVILDIMGHAYCLAKELARHKKCILSITACLPVCVVCPASHKDMSPTADPVK